MKEKTMTRDEKLQLLKNWQQCYENNDMGENGNDAEYDGNLKPIKSLDDLLDLIEG
jgi:hypothetical protein